MGKATKEVRPVRSKVLLLAGVALALLLWRRRTGRRGRGLPARDERPDCAGSQVEQERQCAAEGGVVLDEQQAQQSVPYRCFV